MIADSQQDAPTDIVELFKATQHDHALLRLQHAALQRTLDDTRRELSETNATRAQSEAEAARSAALIASLRQTVDQYVHASVLRDETEACADARLPHVRRRGAHGSTRGHTGGGGKEVREHPTALHRQAHFR